MKYTFHFSMSFTWCWYIACNGSNWLLLHSFHRQFSWMQFADFRVNNEGIQLQMKCYWSHHFGHYKQASLIGNIHLRQLWDVCLTLIIEYIYPNMNVDSSKTWQKGLQTDTTLNYRVFAANSTCKSNDYHLQTHNPRP